MSKILIVDDSPLDRQIIGGLLAKHGYDELFYSEDGAAAMASIEDIAPDLVLTDLLMPGMGGLELVNEVKQKYPLIPVVLMTSSETENVALRALKEGAASYVPKKRLAQDLPETIAGVLGASREQRQKAYAMMRLNRWEADFTVEPDMNLIMTVSAYLMQNFAAMDLCDAGEQVRVGVALAEALQNAFFHGCLELPRELRDSNREEYAKLAESRSKESPYKDRKIQISARFSRGHAIFSVRDDGNGFDVAKATNPFETPSYSRSTFFWSGFSDTRLAGAADPVRMETSLGRGLMLMRTLMDEVKFNEQGNQVTLIKKATKTVPETDTPAALSKPATTVETSAAPVARSVAAPSIMSKPVQLAEKSEPVIAKSAPVVTNPEPAASQPVVSESEAAVTKSEEARAKPESTVATPEPVLTPELVAVEPEPVVMAKPEPVAAKPEPVIAKLEPVAVKPLQIADTPDPVPVKEAPLPKPLQIASKPVLMSKPLQIASKPVLMSKPLQITTKPVSILSKPVASRATPPTPPPLPTNGSKEEKTLDAEEMARREQEASHPEPETSAAEKPTSPTPEAAADQPTLSIKSRKVMVH